MRSNAEKKDKRRKKRSRIEEGKEDHANMHTHIHHGDSVNPILSFTCLCVVITTTSSSSSSSRLPSSSPFFFSDHNR